METPHFGIIICVNDLDACRNFYGHALKLGSPVMDSSFVVEFQSGNLRLILRRTDAAYLKHGSEAAALMIQCSQAELESLQEYMENLHLPLEEDTAFCGSEKYFRGRDPEGNIFRVQVTDGNIQE